MPRSADLRAEASAMAKVEAAFREVDKLGPKVARRIRAWSAEEFSPEAVTDAEANGEQASE